MQTMNADSVDNVHNTDNAHNAHNGDNTWDFLRQLEHLKVFGCR